MLMFARVLLAALMAAFVVGCGDQKAVAPPETPPPEVGVAVVVPRDHQQASPLPARVRALTDIAIVPEISGRLTAVHVEDGAEVAADDLLFEIDPQPYEAEVQRQRQLVEQARAAFSLAETRKSMAEALSTSNNLSKLEIEEVNVAYQTAKAAEATAVAGLLGAELNLSRARITAPTAGVIQEVLVDVGSVVSAQSGALTNLVADAMMEVYTEVDADTVSEYRQALLDNPDLKPSVLTLEFEGGGVYEHNGKMNFQASRVSPVTNSVTFRALFPNPDGVLVDGQAVTLVYRDAISQKAVLVPQAAVQQDQTGRYLMRVGPDNVVQKAYLQLGSRVGSEWLVEKGLKEGDTYIVSGILRARPGQPVTPVQD